MLKKLAKDQGVITTMASMRLDIDRVRIRRHRRKVMAATDSDGSLTVASPSLISTA
jgi:hypothetical protein